MSLFLILFLVLVLALASYFDLKTRRIPNWLNYSALGLSFLWFSSFHLLVIALSLLASLLFGKLIGAGDIKLAAVIAIWSHILNWPQMWLYFSLIAGGGFGLVNQKKSVPFAPFMAIGVLVANMARSMGFI